MRSGRTEHAYSGVGGPALLEEDGVPATYDEAVKGDEAPLWRAAAQREIDACESQQTWTVVKRDTLGRDANVLPVKWVFKKKIDKSGVVVQHKARITPKGFRQKAGVDYFEVFAHTGKYKTLRVVLAIAAAQDLELNQLDVPTAFVRAPLEETVYMELPDGFTQPGMVCKLERSLYGLKQSPRNWNKLLSSFIVNEMQWSACVSDPCLFFRRSRAGRLMLLFVFVDDMQGAYAKADEEEWMEAKAMLTRRFETKDLGDSEWMLGMAITRDRTARTIKLDQSLYVLKLLERFNLQQCKTSDTPAECNNNEQDVEDELTDLRQYQVKVGSLLYLAISTRPDIAFAVHQLSRHMVSPHRRHDKAADRVLRYLAGTQNKGLTFGRAGPQPGGGVEISAYADADWGSNRTDRKSVTGWIARVNGDPVSWACKKQNAVALSTCEAELYASATAAQELLWLRGLLMELGVPQPDKIGAVPRAEPAAATLYGDNQAAIKTAENGVRSERTKHIDIRYRFITDLIEDNKIKMQWISTKQQQADVLTKALGPQQFKELRDLLLAD